jgi:ribosomal protein L24E
VAGDGKIYVLSEQGEATVFTAEAQPRVLARTAVNERCLATPALANGRVYVRTDRNLFCFGSSNR